MPSEVLASVEVVESDALFATVRVFGVGNLGVTAALSFG
jgi:hypothetical protein